MQSFKVLQQFRRLLRSTNAPKCLNGLFTRATFASSCNKASKVVLPLATKLLDRSSCPGTSNKKFSSSPPETEPTVDALTFERACEETLESLNDYFEELIENDARLTKADVSYSSGVLTVAFGEPHGTYVINKQSPNRQIWLSSPTSGPKRYDFITKGEYWSYRHTGETLHGLLQDEIPKIVNGEVDFSKCSHCRL